MANAKNDGKIGVSLGAELLARCDAAIKKANARNRSDFIRDAVEHYLAVLNAQENSKVLTPALESVINSRIAMTEYRISQILYKLAVEIAMTNYIHTEDIGQRKSKRYNHPRPTTPCGESPCPQKQ